MRILWHAAAAALLAWNVAWAQEEVDVRPASAAAETWLALVDAGRYGESWDEGAATFKTAIERLKWETTVQDARGMVGNLVKRKLRTARHAHNLPNAPEGEYVVIQNEARFENRPLASETVTVMKAGRRSWRVAGYFIH
jgi:hypothetical protein